jgi:hypothetical protein
MGHFRKIFPLFVVLSTVYFTSTAQKFSLPENRLFARKYKAGETYRYKITMSEYHNGALALTNVSVCELKVVDSAGVPYDEVHWISKKVIKSKDTTDQTKAATLVKPYLISLSGSGRIDLPKIEVAEMTEPVQDFNTFFVAVSPQIQGINQLKKTGDSVFVDKPVIADFSNGTNILKGEDCLAITAKLVNDDKKEVFVYTSFLAPAQPNLKYIISDMNTPVVANIPNNFQMVTPGTNNNQFNIDYGREYFYINSTIRKSDGKIVKADMFNQLNLKIKVNCDDQYKNCQISIPFAEQRKLTLELLE